MRFRIFIISLISIVTFGLWASASVATAYNPLGNLCNNPNNKAAQNSPACNQNTTQNGTTTNPVVNIIRTASNIIALAAGVSAVIIIIISGFMVATAGGAAPGQRSSDPNKIKTARSALVGALVGMVIVALTWTIITFVTNKFVKT